MRSRLALLGFLLVAAPPALAQSPGFQGGGQEVRVTLSVEQAMLIAQTLGQVGGCDRVSGMATCEMARALIREIQEQVKAQQK